MVSRFRKRPVEIEAIRVGDGPYKKAAEWCGGTIITSDGRRVVGILIKTLEGDMLANLGDWIIRGVKGEHYPCKPDVFDATYERV